MDGAPIFARTGFAAAGYRRLLDARLLRMRLSGRTGFAAAGYRRLLEPLLESGANGVDGAPIFARTGFAAAGYRRLLDARLLRMRLSGRTGFAAAGYRRLLEPQFVGRANGVAANSRGVGLIPAAST